MARAVPEVSRSRAAVLIRAGSVSVDGKVLHRPGAEVLAGQRLEIELPASAASEAKAQDLPIHIVYEDADLAVIDKDAGMVVHPAPGHADGTLVNALLHHIDDLSGVGGIERPGIVHRLDRGTSGLLVVAKRDVAHRMLQDQFAEHSAGRRYLALCARAPRGGDTGRIESLLARHPNDRVRFASSPRTGAGSGRGRVAITHYEVRARAGNLALVECRLETGRTHQVRVHLAEQGAPIVGDPLYGGDPKLPVALVPFVVPNRPFLHAWQLQFTHPDGRPMRFIAPLPADFLAALDSVGIVPPVAAP